jgi:hypothetical protein
MRIFIVPLLIWVIGMGSLSLYTHEREVVRPQTSNEIRAQKGPEGIFGMDITLSFSAQPDAFEVRTNKIEKPATLLVLLNGHEILRRDDKITAGIPILVRPIKGLGDGVNEIYVESRPPAGQAARAHAMRLRLFRDGKKLIEHTYWSEPFMNMSAALPIDLGTARKRKRNHEP